jgi:hypothetical protein
MFPWCEWWRVVFMHKGYLYIFKKELLIENMCGVHKNTPM